LIRRIANPACSVFQAVLQGTPLAFAHHDDDLAFAGLVLGEPPIEPVGGSVLRPDMTAEIGTVDLGNPPLTADTQGLRAGRDGLAQLVRQHKCRLVLDVELAAEREHALAFDFVADGSDGQQIGPQRQLVPGEQGA
jgi:hypothetical protein